MDDVVQPPGVNPIETNLGLSTSVTNKSRLFYICYQVTAMDDVVHPLGRETNENQSRCFAIVANKPR